MVKAVIADPRARSRKLFGLAADTSLLFFCIPRVDGNDLKVGVSLGPCISEAQNEYLFIKEERWLSARQDSRPWEFRKLLAKCTNGLLKQVTLPPEETDLKLADNKDLFEIFDEPKGSIDADGSRLMELVLDGRILREREARGLLKEICTQWDAEGIWSGKITGYYLHGFPEVLREFFREERLKHGGSEFHFRLSKELPI